MPGMLGIINLNSLSDIEQSLEQMFPCLCHESDYEIQKFTLHERKCLIANISIKLNNNPLCYFEDPETKNVCIIGGEIHNYTELEDILFKRKIKLRGKRDAELLLALYMELGDSFLKLLNGWFNLIIYDKKNEKIMLANDRFGFKPLFYHEDDNKFIFAPEVKAILIHKEIQKKLDESSVYEYFKFGTILANKTFFKSIFRIPPTTKVIFSNNERVMENYWSWDEYSKMPKYSKKEAFEKGNEIFEKVIPRYFERDLNTILSLTGGFDTRLIISALNPDIYPSKTITYGHSINTGDNRLATKISSMLKIPHDFISTKQETISMDTLNKGVYICDGMVNNIDTIMAIHLTRESLKNKLCITGKYGTQVFHPGPSRFDLKKYAGNYYYIPKEYVLPNTSDNDLIVSINEECRNYWYSNLTIENSFCLIRTPYTDNDVVELAFRCPDDMKLIDIQKHFIKTHSIRLANIPINHGNIINKRNVGCVFSGMYFKIIEMLTRLSRTSRIPLFLSLLLNQFSFSDNVTVKSYELSKKILSGDAREIMYDDRTLNRNHLIYENAKKMIDDHYNNKSDNRIEIGRILMFELFCRKFID